MYSSYAFPFFKKVCFHRKWVDTMDRTDCFCFLREKKKIFGGLGNFLQHTHTTQKGEGVEERQAPSWRMVVLETWDVRRENRIVLCKNWAKTLSDSPACNSETSFGSHNFFWNLQVEQGEEGSWYWRGQGSVQLWATDLAEVALLEARGCGAGKGD